MNENVRDITCGEIMPGWIVVLDPVFGREHVRTVGIGTATRGTPGQSDAFTEVIFLKVRSHHHTEGSYDRTVVRALDEPALQFVA